MKSRKHVFAPSLDGRLEDRLVLNGARAAAVAQFAGDQFGVPRDAVLSTRAYNNILVNIHRATEQLARSNGSQAAYDRAGNQIGEQLGRLPYARQNGLIEYVNGSLQFYGTNEARQLYSDIRSTVVQYLTDEVGSGNVVIRNTGGRFFSDADLAGLISNGGGHHVGRPPVVRPPVGNPGFGGGPIVARDAVLTSRTYNNILVNIHRATEQLAQSNGSQAAYNRAGNQIGAQLGRLPYARQNGLIEYVNGSLQFYGTNEARQLYSDIRSTIISYLSDQVANGDVVIRGNGGHYFSDADILGPNAAIYQQNTLV